MRHSTTVLATLLAAILIGGLGLASASPASPLQPVYDLSWYTVDTGGGGSTGGAYSLGGTAGQPDAGDLMGGGTHTLQGGFWDAAPAAGCEQVRITAVYTDAAGCTVAFSATLAGAPPYIYLWDFGDGVRSTDPQPTHDYAAADTYTVTLEVWNCGAAGHDLYAFPVVVTCGWRAYLPCVYR